jgi:hypothetical protein
MEQRDSDQLETRQSEQEQQDKPQDEQQQRPQDLDPKDAAKNVSGGRTRFH